jgi:hypothetical protein
MQHKSKEGQTVYQGLGSRKILVAEDVEFNQYIARQILESWGVEVSLANNGVEVLEKLKDSQFDCILMDIQMPLMDGLETAENIRRLKDPAKASIPIIAVTANILKGDREKYLGVGMTDVLSKPIQESSLYAVISKALSIAGQTESATNPPGTFQVPSPEESGERLYDLSLVESLSGGDKTFIKKMVALFIETIPSNINALKQALQKQDWEQVSKMAHKLKSSVDSMGIKTLRNEIREVESKAKKMESLETIPALVEKVDQTLVHCMVQLQDELAP